MRRIARTQRKPNMPVSGSEETFTNLTYGTNRARVNNNCWAWAIDAYADHGNRKLQPGNLSGSANVDLNLTNCDDVRRRALADLRDDIYEAKDADAPCRSGFYKIMSFLDTRDGGKDYHWYKQHRDVLVRAEGRSQAQIARQFGVPTSRVAMGSTHALVLGADIWSHKQGFATGPLIVDACGKLIKDPRKACRRYSEYHYDTFCGAYCVRNKPRAAPSPNNNRSNKSVNTKKNKP